MIMLGWEEPRLDGPREIRREDVAIHDLLKAKDGVVITVPRASVMIAVDTAPNRAATMSIYYECDPKDDCTVKLDLFPVDYNFGDTGEIPAHCRLIGHFWYGGSLVAVYVRDNGERT